MKTSLLKIAMLASLLLALFSTPSMAQASTDSIEHYFINLSNQKWQWMAEKNTDKLDSLFDDNAMFVHMGGYWGKKPELQVIRSGNIWYKHADISRQEVRFAGSSAIVYTTMHLTAVVGGQEVVNPFIVSEVYVMKEEHWRLALLAFTHTASIGVQQKVSLKNAGTRVRK